MLSIRLKYAVELDHHLYVSYDGLCESMIDHILILIQKIDLIKRFTIWGDEALNVSRHRPIICTINIPFSDLS